MIPYTKEPRTRPSGMQKRKARIQCPVHVLTGADVAAVEFATSHAPGRPRYDKSTLSRFIGRLQIQICIIYAFVVVPF